MLCLFNLVIQGLLEEQRPLSPFVRINIAETEFEDKFWPEDNTKETPEPGNVICVAAFFQILNGLDLALLTGRDMDLKPIEVSGKTPIHFNRL